MNSIKISVKSINPCKSVIQTTYDIIKAHGGELKVETKEARPPARSDHSRPFRQGRTGGDDPVGRGEGLPAGQTGSTFIIQLPTA